MKRRRVLAVGGSIALTGCVSYPDADQPSGEELVGEAIETRRGMTDLAARRITAVETPEETLERTERVVRRPPAEQRIEVLESTDPGAPVGSVTVTNRDRTWEYNPETEMVDLQFHGTKVDADRTLEVLETLREEYRLGYGGTDTVDGRDAHLLETRPPVDDTGPRIDVVVGETTYAVPLTTADLEELNVVRRIWLDDEYRYPITERHEVSDDGETLYALTFTYEDLSIDEGVAPETFTFEPPPEAHVETDGREPDGLFDARGEAEANTPYGLPEPDVPDAYALDRITVVEDRFGTTTTLWYDDPTVIARELYVRIREERRFRPDVLEEIEIDGRTAYYRDGRLQSVFRDCGDLNYEVTSLIEDDPLREIAASIACP